MCHRVVQINCNHIMTSSIRLYLRIALFEGNAKYAGHRIKKWFSLAIMRIILAVSNVYN